LQAVILVGGLGKRLRKIISTKPKPLVPINKKPFLEYQIKFLKFCGITDILLCTGYMADQITAYFGDGQNFGVSIKYSYENKPLGTGGAIKNAEKLLDDQFILLNGDSLFLIDLQSMINFHKKNNANCTIAITTKKDESRYGNIKIKNHTIESFKEKTGQRTNHINCGIYIFEKKSFQWNILPEKFSLEDDFFPNFVKSYDVLGFESNSYFIDIGTEKSYTKFQNDLKNLDILKFFRD
jgi:D-glycero-alpha-D-manno-heptose 1-phosphate guanylyltransferase